MATGKSLSEEQNRRLREVVHRVLKERFNGNASAMARAIGFTQGSFSQYLRGLTGGSLRLIDAMVSLSGEPESWFLHGVRTSKGAATRQAATAGQHPRWPDAEREARTKHRRIPDEAWAGARHLSGFSLPQMLTADEVYRLALTWMEFDDKVRAESGRSYQHRRSDWAAEDRLDQMQKELEEGGKKRASRRR